MITLEKILGALTGKENLYRCGRNFTVIEEALNNSGDVEAHNTDATAHQDIRTQINDLDAKTYKDLGFLAEGTLSAFILSKINLGQTKGTFYCSQLSDVPASMPSVANVRYSSNTTLSNTIYVELFTGLDIYVNTLNASNGVWSTWTKLQKDTSMLYLYSNGNECADVTGGWNAVTTRGTVTETKNADNLYVKCEAGSSDGMFVTANTVDLTNYSKLKIEFIADPTNGWTDICVGTNAATNALWDSNTAGMHLAKATIKTIAEVDISSVTGSYYIKVGAGSGSYSGMFINAYRVWLEV